MVSEHQSLRSINSNEFLPSVSRWTYLGGFLLSGTISAAFLMSALVRYNVTVKAPAIVRPVGKIRIVQAPLEGAVASIEVKENQSITKGEIVARIDDAELQIQKRQLEEEIGQYRSQLIQMNAQINALDIQRNAEMDLMKRSVHAAEANLDLNQRNYQTKQISTRTEVIEAEAALKLAQAEMEQYQQLSDTGAVTQLEIQQKEQTFEAAKAKLEGVKAQLNPSGAEVVIAQDQIAQESDRGKSMLANLNQQREQLHQQQTKIQGQINRDLQTLQQVNTDLEKTTVRAPADGVVFRLGLRNSSQILKSGELLAEIAPTNSPLVFKAQVLPQDIGKVSVCDEERVAACGVGKVQLLISAYPHSDYGTLKGAIREISPDAISPDPKSANSASPFYEVTIEPEYSYLKTGKEKHSLKSGMEATADIISRQETVLTFLLREAKLLVKGKN